MSANHLMRSVSVPGSMALVVLLALLHSAHAQSLDLNGNGAADAPAKFFRIVVSDVDTDGDGLNDWEEYQLGLDPFSPNSSGQLDAAGKPLGDYAFAVNRLKLSAAAAPLTGGPSKTGVAIYALDSPTGTGLTGYYYTNSSSTYTTAANFNP